MAYYIGTGFFFGIMSLMDDGIELAIGFHVANNLVTAILVTADWTAFQTESLYKDISTPVLEQELILFLLLIYPLTLFYLGRKYLWNDWRNKLTGHYMESNRPIKTYTTVCQTGITTALRIYLRWPIRLSKKERNTNALWGLMDWIRPNPTITLRTSGSTGTPKLIT